MHELLQLLSFLAWHICYTTCKICNLENFSLLKIFTGGQIASYKIIIQWKFIMQATADNMCRESELPNTIGSLFALLAFGQQLQ